MLAGDFVVRRRILRLEAQEHGVGLRARLREGVPLGEPSLHEHPARPAAIEPRLARIVVVGGLDAGEHEPFHHGDRHPEVGAETGNRAGESWRRDADHGVFMARQPDGRAEGVGRSSELPLPQAVAEDDDGRCQRRGVFGGSESPAARDGDSEDLEVVRRHRFARDELRLLVGEDAAHVAAAGHARERAHAVADIEVVGIRRGQLREVGPQARVDLDQRPTRGDVLVLEQDAVDDAEERGGEADAEGERGNGGRGECRLTPELPHPEGNITEHMG